MSEPKQTNVFFDGENFTALVIGADNEQVDALYNIEGGNIVMVCNDCVMIEKGEYIKYADFTDKVNKICGGKR